MDERLLNDLLECSVCLERLDHSSKVLPCQHTFCKRCLEEILSSRNELRCPECRILVETKVDDLPPNILLIRLLEGIKNHPWRIANASSNESPTSPCKNGSATPSSPTSALAPKPSTSGINANPESRVTPVKQVINPQQPCAKALYSYEAKEPSDLSFKKGDVILLRKQVDENWYHGEIGGQHGFFPASYVYIITPLPSNIPQCKSLYDFKMNDNDEKDCLSFSKGEVITVIRRIDDNWAEGKLKDKIGIFPISFVEMNNVAKTLMKLSANSRPGPSRLAPSTPTSPNGTNANNAISTALPNPNIQRHKQRERRHSLTSITQCQRTPAPQLVHRHSMEIVSPTASEASSSPTLASPSPTKNKTPEFLITDPGLPRKDSIKQDRSPFLDSPPQELPSNTATTVCFPATQAALIPLPLLTSTVNTPSLEETSPLNSTAPTSTPPPIPPHSLYVALYAYKPQKEDELELWKGELYTVSEKCQDGWFKGTSLRTGHVGVFPGNYVQPNLNKAATILLKTLNASTSGMANNSHLLLKCKSASQIPLLARTHLSSSPLNSSRSQPAIKTSPSIPPTIFTKTQQLNNNCIVAAMTKGKPEIMKEVPAPKLPKAQFPPPNRVQQLASDLALQKSYPGGLVRKNSKQTSNGPSSLPPHISAISRNIVPPNVCVEMATRGTNTNLHTDFSDGECSSGKAEKKEKKEKEKLSLMKRLTKKKTRSPPSTPPVIQHARSGSISSLEGHDTGATASVISHKKSSSLDSSSTKSPSSRPKQPAPLVRERYRCIVPFPPNSDYELELKVGDIVYVYKKREDGWYKGTLQRTGKSGLFPGSFVEGF